LQSLKGLPASEKRQRAASLRRARKALVDREEASLEKVASLPADQVMVQTADVSDSRAVDGMVAAVVRPFGRLDVIVNNAGVREDPASITDEKWRKDMSTDIDGVFYGCRASLPTSKRPGARSSTRRRSLGSAAIGA